MSIAICSFEKQLIHLEYKGIFYEAKGVEYQNLLKENDFDFDNVIENFKNIVDANSKSS